MKCKTELEIKQLIDRLQDVYDTIILDERSEVTILDAIETLGSTEDTMW